MLNSKRIFEYFEKKYGLGHVGLFKSIAIASMFVSNKEIIPLSVLTIGPSGQFKTRTTAELYDIFANKPMIELGSDFTIHSLIDRFKGGLDCNNKTLDINDLTLLLSSKNPRTKDRLLNALAEVLSDGKYHYGERNKPDIIFKSRVNIIANITKNSYMQNRKKFLDNTFIERFVPLQYSLTVEKQEAFIREATHRKELFFGEKIKLKRINISNLESFTEKLIALAKDYQAITRSPSLPRSADKIKGIITGLCCLDQEELITEQKIEFITQFMSFFNHAEGKEADIIRLYNQGVPIQDICKQLNYNSNYPYKVIAEYKEKGLLS